MLLVLLSLSIGLWSFVDFFPRYSPGLLEHTCLKCDKCLDFFIASHCFDVSEAVTKIKQTPFILYPDSSGVNSSISLRYSVCRACEWGSPGIYGGQPADPGVVERYSVHVAVNWNCAED